MSYQPIERQKVYELIADQLLRADRRAAAAAPATRCRPSAS